MFTSIKTSRANKDIVTDLSRKFNLGAENIIARIALTYSLSKDRLLSLTDIADSQGKEYSKNVLFGNNLPYYIGLICVKYGLYKTDKDIPKYIKLHIDDGLQLMNKELQDNPNLNMLRDVQFKHSYSSGYDEPKDFFTEALIESSTFDLGLGFFSSSGIRSLAYGFALFIANGGKMRVVMNHLLSKEDKEAIENGQKHLVEDFENRILSDIKKLAKTLDKC